MSPTEEHAQTVLVVDDEPTILSVVSRILGKAGFHTLTAPSGPEAVSVCRGFSKPIDLLLTDVTMPEMSGLELARCIAEHQPKVRVLFMTGYAHRTAFKIILESHRELNGCAVVDKPFTPSQLVQKVRDMLDQDFSD